MRPRLPVVREIVSLVSVLALTSCASSGLSRDLAHQTFLSDYDRLQKGGGGQPELVYAAPGVDWSTYDAILLDPVGIWRSDISRDEGISHNEAQLLANYFYTLIDQDLSQVWRITRDPGQKTLRMTVALTIIDDGRPTLDVVSTTVPDPESLGTIERLLGGEPTILGRAALEVRMVDAQSGAVLFEGFDEKVGGRALDAQTLGRWSDVEDILSAWSQRTTHALCSAQGRSGCPAGPST